MGRGVREGCPRIRVNLLFFEDLHRSSDKKAANAQACITRPNGGVMKTAPDCRSQLNGDLPSETDEGGLAYPEIDDNHADGDCPWFRSCQPKSWLKAQFSTNSTVKAKMKTIQPAKEWKKPSAALIDQ